jgi:hypothetical protein
MRKQDTFLFAAIVLVGCSRADVETLGRIGQRVAQRTDALLNAEPNKSMIRTLPMLQAPKPAEMKDAAEPKVVPPRLSVE